MIDVTQMAKRDLAVAFLKAEASFDGLHEDKGLHTGGRTIIGREPTSRQGGWQTLRMLRDPQATKQGAKGTRPLPKMSEHTSMVDLVGTTSYGYDAAGRLTSSTNPHGFAVSYHYDAAGNLDQLTYPGNKTVYYTYDELNRLHTATIGWITPNPVATYQYDAAGRLDYVTNFNGTTTGYGYDNANRLTTLENRKSDATILANYAFTLDGNGNRTNTTQTEQYTNLPSMGATSYTYNLQKNRLLSAGGNSFTYDDEGQLGTGYGSTYTFDYEHRLTAIGTAQFSYDGSGNRIQATRDGVVTRYIYDAAGNLLAEADGSNNITKYYIHGAGLLAMVTPANQVYCYHFNATGHTMAVTDSAQAVANKYSYDAYGTVSNQQEAMTQPFKYVGQLGVMAEPNGFYYMRARYYDPQVGRFVSEDPIGFDGGDENLYAYVGDNPVMGVDPSGLCGNWLNSVETINDAVGLVSLGVALIPSPGITQVIGGAGLIATGAIGLTIDAAQSFYYDSEPNSHFWINAVMTAASIGVARAVTAPVRYSISTSRFRNTQTGRFVTNRIGRTNQQRNNTISGIGNAATQGMQADD